MSALPALTRSYFTRANQTFPGGTTTQALIEAQWGWHLLMNLLDLAAGGSTGGSRAANSIWIPRGASNGTTATAITSAGVSNATVATIISSTFTPGQWVRGASPGTPHTWALVENTTLGYELLLNWTAGAGGCSVAIAKSGTFGVGTGSTTGTTTQFPLPATAQAATICMNGTAWNSTDAGGYAHFGDTTNLNGVNYVHFTVAATGEFHFEMSRAGLGCFSSFVAVWKTINNAGGDTQNTFLFASDTTATGRGTPGSARASAAGFTSGRTPNTGYLTNGGIIYPMAGNTTAVALQGTDVLSSAYNATSCDVMSIAPQYLRRGTLPDWHWIGIGPVGGSIPDIATQVRTIIGDLVLPFTAVAPLI